MYWLYIWILTKFFITQSQSLIALSIAVPATVAAPAAIIATPTGGQKTDKTLPKIAVPQPVAAAVASLREEFPPYTLLFIILSLRSRYYCFSFSFSIRFLFCSAVSHIYAFLVRKRSYDAAWINASHIVKSVCWIVYLSFFSSNRLNLYLRFLCWISSSLIISTAKALNGLFRVILYFFSSAFFIFVTLLLH